MLNRGADPRARQMGAGWPADMRRAQSGQVPCSEALARRGNVLDEVSAAILADAQASARTMSSPGPSGAKCRRGVGRSGG